MLGNVAYPLGCCIDAARRDGDMSWEHVNKLWRERFATDARYKVWFIAATSDMYMMKVGSQDILIRFINGIPYSRPYNDSNIYERKPCYKCGELYGDYIIYIGKWQNEVLI